MVGDLETSKCSLVLVVALVAAMAFAHRGTPPAEPPTIQLIAPESIAMSWTRDVHEWTPEHERKARLARRLCSCGLGMPESRSECCLDGDDVD
ncbi:MAG TPA: hypothetical protein VGG74_30065 [Kofleriaceae bacterium]|jgi:hypothetical protein